MEARRRRAVSPSYYNRCTREVWHLPNSAFCLGRSSAVMSTSMLPLKGDTWGLVRIGADKRTTSDSPSVAWYWLRWNSGPTTCWVCACCACACVCVCVCVCVRVYVCVCRGEMRLLFLECKGACYFLVKQMWTVPHNLCGKSGPYNLYGSCAVPWETSVAISTTTTNKSLILHRTTATEGNLYKKGTHAGCIYTMQTRSFLPGT